VNSIFPLGFERPGIVANPMLLGSTNARFQSPDVGTSQPATKPGGSPDAASVVSGLAVDLASLLQGIDSGNSRNEAITALLVALLLVLLMQGDEGAASSNPTSLFGLESRPGESSFDWSSTTISLSFEQSTIMSWSPGADGSQSLPADATGCHVDLWA